MSFTLRELEERLSDRIGDYFAGAASSDGAADGTTLISSDLLLRPGQSWVPFICEITSGDSDEEQRVIDDYSVDGTVATLTLANPFSNKILDTITFRLHKLPVEEKFKAIDSVLRGLANIIPVGIQEVLISGECLRNPSMEFWRSESELFDWETIVGTVAKESSIIYDGKHSLKLTGTGTAGSVRQFIPLERELAGVTLTLTAYVYGTAHAGVTLGIAQGDTSDSEALGASNAWTKLTATITLSGDAETIHRRPIVTLGNTQAAAAYFDAVHLAIPSHNQCYWLPYSEVYHHLAMVEIGPRWDVVQTLAKTFGKHNMPDFFANNYGWYPTARGRVYPYPELINQGAQGTLPNPYWMRLTGVGHWPMLSDEDDTIELSEEQAEYVALSAGIQLGAQGIGAQYMSDDDYWTRLQAQLGARLTQLEPNIRKAKPAIDIKYWRN